MMKMLRKSKGFTLIELMIVISIIAILLAIVIPNIAGYLGRDKYAPKQIEIMTQEEEAQQNKGLEPQAPAKEGEKKKL